MNLLSLRFERLLRGLQLCLQLLQGLGRLRLHDVLDVVVNVAPVDRLELRYHAGS